MNDIGFTTLPNVTLRVTPSDPDDGLMGVPFVTPLFEVSNEGELPFVVLRSVQRVQYSPQTLELTIFDSSSNPADLTLEYSIDGQSAWAPLVQESGSEIPLLGMATAPAGVLHTLHWDASALVADAAQPFSECYLRAQARDVNGTLGWITFDRFYLGNIAPVASRASLRR